MSSLGPIGEPHPQDATPLMSFPVPETLPESSLGERAGIQPMPPGSLRGRVHTAALLRGGGERPIPEIAEQVAAAARGEVFALVLERQLQPLLKYDRAHHADHWREKLREDPPRFCRRFGAVLAEAVTRPEFLELLMGMQRDGFIDSNKLSLADALQNKKLIRPLLRSFLKSEIDTPEAQTANVLGIVSPLAVQALEVALICEGQALRPQGLTGQKLFIQSLALPFLGPQETRALAHLTCGEDPRHLANLLLAIVDLPNLPLVSRQAQQSRQLKDRFQRNLALHIAESISLDDRAELEPLIDVFRQVLSEPGIACYLYFSDNDRAVIRRVHDILKTGKAELRCMSCPDYTGSTTVNEHGQSVWQFDFRGLGSAEGVVARKGMAWVEAWVRALKQHVSEVSVLHLEPSFEVARGLRVEGTEVLSAPEAYEKLRASNQAIKAAYAANGLDIRVALFGELLADDLFELQRREKASLLSAEREADPQLAKLFAYIFKSREALYRAWYPPLENEGPAEHRERLIREVIPHQAAEYAVVGELLTAPAHALVLAYDSAPMSELNGYLGLPVMFGLGKSELDYEGA